MTEERRSLVTQMPERRAHTPRSTSHLPDHGRARRVSERIWDSVSLRDGASASEAACRP
jgi:hypothetical protein